MVRSQDSNDSEPVDAGRVVPTREGYDRWAEVYDHEDNPLIQLEERHLPPLLGSVARLDVADIGCGTGRHALRLAEAGGRVVALDFSERMLDRARDKPHGGSIRFERHDLSEPLPLADASFDRVLCCLVLEHIRDVDALFAEFARICRPDGFVLVSAMHPAMMLRGVQARFEDPETGCRILPAGFPNQIADYVIGACRAGLRIDHVSEHPVDAALVEKSPRAAKYLDWPMLFLLRATRGPRA